MTLYLSRRKLLGAWLLFFFGLLLTLAAAMLSADLFELKSFLSDVFFLGIVVPCLGIMWLGMYALKQIYSCPRCGTCIIKEVLFTRLRRKKQAVCPDCVRSIDIVMER